MFHHILEPHRNSHKMFAYKSFMRVCLRGQTPSMACFLIPRLRRQIFRRAHMRKNKQSENNKNQCKLKQTKQTNKRTGICCQDLHASFARFPEGLLRSLQKASRQNFTSGTSLQQFYIFGTPELCEPKKQLETNPPRSRCSSPGNRKVTTVLHFDTILSPWYPKRNDSYTF